MRLLSVKEISKKDPTDDKIREIKYLDKLIKNSRETWNKQKLDPEKERIEREFISFNENIQTKKNSLLKEVADLEDRKERALEPLDQKAYELSLRENDLKELEDTLEKKEIEVEKDRGFLIEKSLLIEDKLAEMAEREEKISKNENILVLQQSTVKTQLEELNKKWLDYHFKEKGLVERENLLPTLIQLESRKLEALKPLDDKRKELERREFKVKADELRIKKLLLKQANIKNNLKFLDQRQEEVASKEIKNSNLNQRQQKLKEAEKNIQLREKMVDDIVKVGESLRELVAQKESQAEELAKKLDIQKIEIEKEKDFLKEQTAFIAKKTDELILWEKQLKENETLSVSEVTGLKSQLEEFKKDLEAKEELVGLTELGVDYKTKRLKLGEKTLEKRAEWMKHKIASLRDREKQLIKKQVELKRYDQLRP
jgi:hypothetical protein